MPKKPPEDLVFFSAWAINSMPFCSWSTIFKKFLMNATLISTNICVNKQNESDFCDSSNSALMVVSESCALALPVTWFCLATNAHGRRVFQNNDRGNAHFGVSFVVPHSQQLL